MKYVWLLVRALVIWIVPVIVSFFFYTPQGELTTSYALFKSAMIVTLTLTVFGVNSIRPQRNFPAVVVAVTFTVLSFVLDLFTIVPLGGMSLPTYIEEVALTYIIIPLMTWGMLRHHPDVQLQS